jgi:hypothetical protein
LVLLLCLGTARMPASSLSEIEGCQLENNPLCQGLLAHMIDFNSRYRPPIEGLAYICHYHFSPIALF